MRTLDNGMCFVIGFLIYTIRKRREEESTFRKLLQRIFQTDIRGLAERKSSEVDGRWLRSGIAEQMMLGYEGFARYSEEYCRVLAKIHTREGWMN